MYKITIDVGGTFTDLMVLDESGAIRQFKSPTTYPDPSIGFMNALELAADAYGRDLGALVADVDVLIHGTTLATNALIDGSGAAVGMLTTRNFRDVLEIRRGHKNVHTSMYDVFLPPYKPLVPRARRLEVAERVLHDGSVLQPLDEDEARAAAEQLKADGVESVAVGFLHAYANPAHEQRAAEIAREVLGPDCYIVTSADILPMWREWERFSTTVLSAYLGPVVQRYLTRLSDRLAEAGFRGRLLMMLSDGLVGTLDHCIAHAVQMVSSGPAAAPAAALEAGAPLGARDLLSIDMGGTSLDVCVIAGGEVPMTRESWVEQERVATKIVDVHSVGAGGGSIAWLDSLGLLRVGPRSAGSTPGPAAYGKGGTEPTVTDADVLLGYLPVDTSLGGEIALRPDRAAAAIETVAGPLGMDADEAAQAIFTTVNSFMADQITEVSTRRGHDVRDFTLVAGGGMGPLHGPFIAKLLGVDTVLVPRQRRHLLGVRDARDGRGADLHPHARHARQRPRRRGGEPPVRRDGGRGARRVRAGGGDRADAVGGRPLRRPVLRGGDRGPGRRAVAGRRRGRDGALPPPPRGAVHVQHALEGRGAADAVAARDHAPGGARPRGSAVPAPATR